MAKVTIYANPDCGACKRAKEFLEENDIQYTYFDVTSDQEKAEEMKEKSGSMSTPVLDINGEIIVGFDEPEIKNKLG